MSTEHEFQPFQKIARLRRDTVVTEKIDGTNAQIHITDDGLFLVGSRTRYITPEADNFGFARWAMAHEDDLRTLGPGRHYGEWWGNGIQRGYGLQNGDKRFSLFNVHRYGEARPACCGVVPVLYEGPFRQAAIDASLEELRCQGSRAVYGFMKPEGVVVFHSASSTLYKITIEKDDAPKSRH